MVFGVSCSVAGILEYEILLGALSRQACPISAAGGIVPTLMPCLGAGVGGWA